MNVSEINIYPVKSLKGISVEEAIVEKRGFRFDRRWMITDKNGEFFTQREFPKLATISVQLSERDLILNGYLKNHENLKIPLSFENLKTQKVRVWQSVCEARVMPERINQWLSKVLEADCQMVYMPDETERGINKIFRQSEEIVSFADGYPFMLIGENSLANLNEKLEIKLPMNRFRPNIVVSNCEAFAEDSWNKIQIGETVFRATKPCSRCVMTTIEQNKGEYDGKEPLKTLARYRTAKDIFPDNFESLDLNANSVLFGQNFVAENFGGKIQIGDEVKILA